jgi:hypothetical protein
VTNKTEADVAREATEAFVTDEAVEAKQPN